MEKRHDVRKRIDIPLINLNSFDYDEYLMKKVTVLK